MGVRMGVPEGKHAVEAPEGGLHQGGEHGLVQTHREREAGVRAGTGG